jgi:hypothetical protein
MIYRVPLLDEPTKKFSEILSIIKGVISFCVSAFDPWWQWQWQAVCSFNQINRVLLINLVSFSNKPGLLGNKPGLL